MDYTKTIFLLYLFFAIYCAGSMTVLQLQHFALYSRVGPENFKEYISANNRAAFLPSIFPALLVTILSIFLLFSRPEYMPLSLSILAVALNVINIGSTAIWQGKLHGQLAELGYNQAIIAQLANTNWVRTFALLAQGILAVIIAAAGIR